MYKYVYHINIIMPYRYANGLTIMYNEYNQYKHEIVVDIYCKIREILLELDFCYKVSVT